MNTQQLKTYAPEARRAFIAAVSAQAAKLGITARGSAEVHVQGDVLLVAGQAFPASYTKPRKKLADRIEAHGFDQTMEAIAYTWFNRFVAIRYMELHGYLDHGYRVLGGRPEILDHAADVDLPGLDREKAIELKLDGTKDEDLYRLLLLAQCNALNKAMPFLFEKIGDETELLLPANLLHTDSLIRQLVEQVDEALWQEIEIIGWLYQFYISEKKNEVIGKVVKSEDIPAATQLFTPNWIVKYMVQNSLGAQWLATYPQSPLKEQMEYYIEPAEQTPEVQQQLREITPTSLDPEAMTLIDPASGSGHILVEAYELFKAIYLERGYRQRDVAQLILEKNVFGLEICPRAAQLTGFALMMKGRADDRRLFERGVKLNVMALVDSAGFDAEGLAKGVELGDCGLKPGDLTELKLLFEHATTFGSLIQVPEELAKRLPALKRLSEAASQDLFVSDALKRLAPLVQQAEVLAGQYDAVAMNPPYIGERNLRNAVLKNAISDYYRPFKADVFACFMKRSSDFCQPGGYVSMVTMHSWMFLSSFKTVRDWLLGTHGLESLVHLGAGAFPEISGEVVQSVVFAFKATRVEGQVAVCADAREPSGEEKASQIAKRAIPIYAVQQDDFSSFPDRQLAYWASPSVRNVFRTVPALGSACSPLQGATTSDNDRFLRLWHEVDHGRVGFQCATREVAQTSGNHWFPFNKGGAHCRWYGNRDFLLNYENDGEELKRFHEELNKTAPGGRLKNQEKYFEPHVSWSRVSGSEFCCRTYDSGFVFSDSGSAIFPRPSEAEYYCGLLNSVVFRYLIRCLSPSIHFQAEHVSATPAQPPSSELAEIAHRCNAISMANWDAYERSWDFQSLPVLTASSDPTPALESSYTAWITQNRETIAEMKRLEEENNRLFIDAYGLADELTPDIPLSQITLTVNPAYRYGGKLTEEDQWTRFRQDTMEELVSYAIGCMMGRYSLDAPGLVYAHSGNEGFDPSRYPTFLADDDGIVPLSDTEWFDDDAAHRLIEFISVAWDKIHLEANLTFLADNLSPKKNESSLDTIRRYLCDHFFKDHLQTYKKRPIYWLFSSGKQKAFQCLVYLHRYNEGTLSRMRSEYVIPLQGKMAARLEKLQGDVQAASSSAQSKRLEKERAKLEKQQVELLAFDEKLRHYADMRISLDLDDGVKINYGKFGDLLAEVKAVHGKKADSV